MKIKDFITSKGIRNYHFAQALGIPGPHLSEIIHGRRGVPLTLALKIVEISEGQITLQDLIDIPTNRKTRIAKDKSALGSGIDGHSSVNLQAAQEWCQKYLRQGNQE